MPTGITLKGFDQFRNKLNNLPSVLKEEVGGETLQAAKMWEQSAKLAAPVDQGRLRNEIVGSQTGALSSQVVCNVEYAAYLEWGTKTKVSVPAEIADYAAQFRGAGPGGGPSAKVAIYAWMNRVGIPVEAQWFLFISIIVNGIKPHPFFFIQRPKVEIEYIKRVETILNTEH